MRPIFVIDISGKVLNYDYALCKELSKLLDVTVVAHKQGSEGFKGKRLPIIRLIPLKYKNSSHVVKRALKAIEGILNYIWLLLVVLVRRPNVMHFQWFPFMEFCSVDNLYVSMLKILKPSLRIVLTVHNLYPHDISNSQKSEYRNRFVRMDRYVDHYIVHVESTRRDVQAEFGIPKCKITVVPHGIFTVNYTPRRSGMPKGRHFIMFGNNTPYKGTDILIEAIQQLPSDMRDSIKLTVAGQTSDNYLTELKAKSEGLDTFFIPTFIPEQQLYSLIDDADYIALPYRQISQSGVLLLALYFRKPLIVSDLPSFKETLKGFEDNMFFTSNNSQSLARLIERHLRGEIDIDEQLSAIDKLVDLYSWKKSAIETCAVYNILGWKKI